MRTRHARSQDDTLEAEVIECSHIPLREDASDITKAMALLIESETSYYHELFGLILADMEVHAFQDIPSVNSNHTFHLQARYNKFDMLRNIDLYSHTMHVFVETLPLISNMPEKLRAIQMILALVHDFGKCPAIVVEVDAQARTPHNAVSADYFEKLANRARHELGCAISDDLTRFIMQILRNHHPKPQGSKESKPDGDQPEVLHTSLLNRADFAARDHEISLIMSPTKIEGGMSSARIS